MFNQINMYHAMKRLITLITLVVALLIPSIATAQRMPAKVVEPVVEEGIFIVLIDQYGIEHMIELSEGIDGNYVNSITLGYDPWGSFYWDPNLTDEENLANWPKIPFYFLIDGVRYGAGESLVETYLGNPLENPLTNEVEDGFYTVYVGFVYNIGVVIVGENEYYLYAGVEKIITEVTEMNTDKSVASVRYFNMSGKEMPEADGMTIVVTTYSDGTTSVAKVVK